MLKTVSTWFRGRTFAANAANIAGGAAAGQILALLASPIITRLYPPAEFGVFAVYLSIISIFAVIVSMRYEIAIPLARTDETAANVFVASLGIGFAVALLVGLGVWLSIPIASPHFDPEMLRIFAVLIPIGLVAAALYQTFNYWAIRRKTYTTIARTKISQSIALVVTQVGLGLMRFGPVGLILGDMAGRAGGSGTLLKRSVWADRHLLRHVTMRRMRTALNRYRRFAIYSSPSGLLNSAGLQLPVIFLTALFGVHIAGLFALAQRIIMTPIWLVSQSISQVYLGTASELARTDPRALRRLFLRISLALALVSAVPFAALFLTAPTVFMFIFGAEWEIAGRFAQMLTVAFYAQIIVSPLSFTLQVLELQSVQLILDVVRLVCICGAFFIAFIFQMTALEAALLYGLVLASCYVALWAVSLQAVRNHAEG